MPLLRLYAEHDQPLRRQYRPGLFVPPLRACVAWVFIVLVGGLHEAKAPIAAADEIGRNAVIRLAHSGVLGSKTTYRGGLLLRFLVTPTRRLGVLFGMLNSAR